jgi:molybdopterin/thiamine biosynthesis adenylyltransferase
MMLQNKPKLIFLENVSEISDLNCIYTLVPIKHLADFYAERVNRNLGWISSEEQEILHQSVVGIAGCGGMGGVVAELLLRVGVGEIRIADPEIFDSTNIHRQIAAGINTVGLSKAVETARRLRTITDDTKIVVYPQGITEETAEHFVEGCHLVLDEVEAFAVFARILLHKMAREKNVDIFNCNSIGAGTRLFWFTSDTIHIEEILKLSYQEAKIINTEIQQKSLSKESIKEIGYKVVNALVPELPEYCANDSDFSNKTEVLKRVENGQASILATNPYGSASFLANHVIFHLLRHSRVKRNIIRPVKMIGYLYRDDLLLQAKVVTKQWWK